MNDHDAGLFAVIAVVLVLKLAVISPIHISSAQVNDKPSRVITYFAAPVMEGKVMSAGDTVNVWPDATGKTIGQAITPLFKSAPVCCKGRSKTL